MGQHIGIGVGVSYGGIAYSPFGFAPDALWDTTVQAYQDSGRTLFAGSGDPVGSLTDRTGNGHHQSQTSALVRPSLASSIAPNGSLALLFGGSNKMFVSYGVSLAASTYVLVGKFKVSATDYQVVGGDPVPSQRNQGITPASAGSHLYLEDIAGQGALVAAAAFPSTFTNAILIGRFAGDGTGSLYRDGAVIASGFFGSSGTSHYTGFTIGSDAGTVFGNCYIYRAMTFGRSISDVEVASITAGERAFWGF